VSTLTEPAVLRRERHGSIKALPIVGPALAWLNWQTGVRVIAPLGALYVEGWPAFIGALLVQEGGLWLARRISAPANRQLATGLFLAAYGLRILIALPSHYVAKLGNGNGALYRDDYTSDLVGEWLVRIAHGEGATAVFPGHQYLLDSVYSYLLMGIYAVFGYTPLLPKLLNISLAALCAGFTFEIASKIFSRRAALIAALGTAFLPSLVVWSVATLKETLVLFVSLVALWALQALAEADRERRVSDALVVLLGATLLLLDLRATSAFIVVGLLGVFLLSRSRVRLRPWQVGLAGVVIAGILVGSSLVVRERTSNRPLSATFEDIALQVRHRRAQEAAGAGSQLRTETDVATTPASTLPAAEAMSDAAPFSFMGDVVDPLGYALLAPTPWQASSTLELAASAEMLVWYVLLLTSLFAWRAGPRQPLFVVGLIAYGVANWLILAAVEGNVGNLLRHRMMLDPVLLIMGAAGLEWLWLRARRSSASIRTTGRDNEIATLRAPQRQR
jgi:hypothetical protein